MTNAKKLASYRTIAVDTATPGKLILMLYDGALRFLHAAEQGFQMESLSARQETVHNNLIKAQNVISELQRCLNIREGGDVAINLFRLYDFMNTRLMDANVRKQPENIRIVAQLLGEIRDAWEQMLQEQGTPAGSAAGLSLSA